MQINATNLAALYTGFKAAFNTGFNDAPVDWDKIATQVTSTTKIETYAWLGQWPAMREWIGSRVLKQLDGKAYTLTNKDFESTVVVDRNDIEDDANGIYGPMMRELGYAAATHPDELVFAQLAAGFAGLCYDGKPFFAPDHPVGAGTVSNMTGGAGSPWFLLDTRRALKPLIFQKRKDYAFTNMTKPDDELVFMSKQYRYGVDARAACGYGFWQTAYGSKAALDSAALGNAQEAMMAFKSDEGRPLNIRPNLLVVGPSNATEAKKLLNAELILEGGAAVSNIHVGSLTLLVSPYLP